MKKAARFIALTEFSSDEKVVEFIIQQTELKIIVCSADLIEKVIEFLEKNHI